MGVAIFLRDHLGFRGGSVAIIEQEGGQRE